MTTENSANVIRRDVVEEAFELLDSTASSTLWRHATADDAAAVELAASLLQGELDGKHTPAVKAASEVLDER